MNDYFSSHFEVPKVSKWHYLKNQFPMLPESYEHFNEVMLDYQSDYLVI